MHTSSNIAFKEWAVIVDALGRGRQVVILRKGGIVETKGKFTVDHDQFWLFPTLYHQQMDSVIPAAQTDFVPFSARFQSEAQIQIEFFVKAEKIIECADLSRVKALQGQHIWKKSVVEERFHWGKTNGVHVILARVYRLPRPETLPLLPDYGGCKSWVELERPISTAQLNPVLPDAEYQAMASRVLAVV